MRKAGPGVTISKRAATHFIEPTPGPNPFKELLQRMDDGACGSKTFRIVASALLYLSTVKPQGGRIPHTTIAKISGGHHADVRQVLDSWAGVLFNQMLKGIDAQGKPSTATYHLTPCPCGQGTDSKEPKSLSGGTLGAMTTGGQGPRLSTSCPPGQGDSSEGDDALSGEGYDCTVLPGHSEPLYTSYNTKNYSRSTLDYAASLAALFSGDQNSIGMDLPSDRPFRPVADISPKKIMRTLVWHLDGRVRFHLYPIRTRHPYQGCVKLGAFDLDGPDRLADAERLLAALASRGVAAYLERSLSGAFHVWFFLSTWTHAGTVHRWMKSVLRAESIVAEVRPSTPEIGSGPHPGQMAIALPFFGDGGDSLDICRVLDPYLLSPIPLDTFLEKVELNDPGALLKARSTTKPQQYASVPSFSIPCTDVESLVKSWPPIREGEIHTAKNGKVKGGRNDAAVAHAGELAATGLSCEEILPYMERWNATCIPPLGDSELRRCMAWLRKG